MKLFRRHIGRALGHHAGKHLLQQVVLLPASGFGHDGQILLTLSLQEVEQTLHGKFQSQVIWVGGSEATQLQMGLFPDGRNEKRERQPLHDATQLSNELGRTIGFSKKEQGPVATFIEECQEPGFCRQGSRRTVRGHEVVYSISIW